MKKLLLTLAALVTIGSSSSVFATLIYNKTESPIEIEYARKDTQIVNTLAPGKHTLVPTDASITKIVSGDGETKSLAASAIVISPNRIEVIGTTQNAK